MKTTWIGLCLLLYCAGCGNGDWVDAPTACAGAWGTISLAQMDLRKPANKQPEASRADLKQFIEDEMNKERKKGTSEERLKQSQDALEAMIATAARGVCGNIGKSYTGTWECSPEQQRVKCK